MKQRHLGNSGLRVSQIGLGCNVFGPMDNDRAKSVIHKAIDSGITFFDTADVYGGRGKSEEQIGNILGDRRKEIVLATKFAMPMSDDGSKRGGSRRYIMQAVEDSLRRLKTDWIDLYQMHAYDPGTPIDETLRALDDLVRAGKVRYIGCSNHPAWRVVESAWTAKTNSSTPFISTQNGYSLINRAIEADIMPAAEAYGLGVIPYSPLAGGLLSGKYKKGEDAPSGTRLSRPGYGARVLSDKNLDKVEALRGWAAQRGKTTLDVAFAWLLSHKVISSVIAGATLPEQIEQNAAAGDYELTADEVKEVEALVSDQPAAAPAMAGGRAR
jgi:aryl-alcohol dehydrogenase-like predicted oxidoreductase